MITLKIKDEVIGHFLSVRACWMPIYRLYSLLEDQHSDCLDWCLVNDDLSYMDGRGWLDAPDFDGTQKGGYQHPDGMPAGIWYALCEDASAFNQYLQFSGWVPHELKDYS